MSLKWDGGAFDVSFVCLAEFVLLVSFSSVYSADWFFFCAVVSYSKPRASAFLTSLVVGFGGYFWLDFNPKGGKGLDFVKPSYAP